MNIKENVGGFGKSTWRQAIILFVVIGVGVCVFNYTDAQKNDDIPNENPH